MDKTIRTSAIMSVRGMNGRVCAFVFLGLAVQTLRVSPWRNIPQGSVAIAVYGCQDIILNKNDH